MVTSRDYTAEAIEACRAVLLELVHLMGEFHDHLVVVGGWVPALLLASGPERYVGTLDVDLAVDFQRLPDETYQSVLQTLESRGYRQDPSQPFRFRREVPVAARQPIIVVVDLLAGEYGGTGRSRRTQPIQDGRARKARGCDLAFDKPEAIQLEGRLPGGGQDSVTLRVAGIVPWLVMKGMALADRVKEKDAYDVYVAVRNYPGGIPALAEAFREHLAHGLVREGLAKIRRAFFSADHVGPKWVADFLEISDLEERAIIQRRAYELVATWLDSL
ncbi:MAG: hypothetical protein ACHQ7N_14505 [Candidatus Methylomirabilales bacterium]